MVSYAMTDMSFGRPARHRLLGDAGIEHCVRLLVTATIAACPVSLPRRPFNEGLVGIYSDLQSLALCGSALSTPGAVIFGFPVVK